MTYKNLSLQELANYVGKDLMEFEYSHPIEIEALANMVGLRVLQISHFNKSGELSVEDYIIKTNADEHPFRQRYTVAHELGHFAKGHGSSDRDEIYNYTEDDKPKEKQANDFAAELLMPEYKVKEMCIGKTKKIIQEEIEDIALFFAVSKPAMSYRLVNLGILDNI